MFPGKQGAAKEHFFEPPFLNNLEYIFFHLTVAKKEGIILAGDTDDGTSVATENGQEEVYKRAPPPPHGQCVQMVAGANEPGPSGLATGREREG